LDSDDEFADFIEPTAAERQESRRRRKRASSSSSSSSAAAAAAAADGDGATASSGRRSASRTYGITQAQLDEAADIFGDFASFLREDREERCAMDEDEDDNDEAVAERFGVNLSLDVEPEQPQDTRGVYSDRAAADAAAAANADAELSVLAAIYEPPLLAESYVLPADDRIRQKDVPERLQARLRGLGEPTQEELAAEAHWICTQHPGFLHRLQESSRAAGADDGSLDERGERLVLTVAQVLDLMLREHFETPYIAAYRKDYWMDSLDERELWDVAKYDQRYADHRANVLRLRKLYQAAGLSDQVEQLEQLALTANDLADRVAHFRLHHAHQLTELGESGLANAHQGAAASSSASSSSASASVHRRPSRRRVRRATRQSAFEACRSAGLVPLARRFGLSAQELAANLQDNYAINEPLDEDFTPDEAADAEREKLLAEQVDESDTTAVALVARTRMLSSSQSALAGCRSFLAAELAAEPLVRKTLRDLYEINARLSTRPTAKGRELIDTFHHARVVKRLLDKPADNFAQDSYLQVVQAEREGLIVSEITVAQGQEKQILHALEQLYCSDRVSELAELWNEQRKEVLAEALKLLYPVFERGLRASLQHASEQWVLHKCADALRAHLMSGPYCPDHGDSRHPPPVCVVSVLPASEANEPVMCVCINEKSEVVDHLKLSFISYPSHENVPALDRERRSQDLTAVGHFLSQHRPDVIVIGACDLSARRLQQDMELVRSTLGDDDEERMKVSNFCVAVVL
jgi:transcription elongation factor SPT6